MTDPIALAEASMMLSHPTEPKVFCPAAARHPRTGYIVNKCTMHLGHVDQDGNPNAHVDTHTGARWMA